MLLIFRWFWLHVLPRNTASKSSNLLVYICYWLLWEHCELWGNNCTKLINAMWTKQPTLNSTVKTILLKCELAPSAGIHSSREVCLLWGHAWHPTEFPSSCQFRSGKFFDQRSSFRKLLCKFAFFFPLFKCAFQCSHSSLLLFYAIVTVRCSLRCLVCWDGKKLPSFIYSLNKLWFKAGWLLMRDENLHKYLY